MATGLGWLTVLNRAVTNAFLALTRLFNLLFVSGMLIWESMGWLTFLFPPTGAPKRILFGGTHRESVICRLFPRRYICRAALKGIPLVAYKVRVPPLIFLVCWEFPILSR